MLVLQEPKQPVSLPQERRRRCYAIEGDNRYHSIMGGASKGLLCGTPSDTAPALMP